MVKELTGISLAPSASKTNVLVFYSSLKWIGLFFNGKTNLILPCSGIGGILMYES